MARSDRRVAWFAVILSLSILVAFGVAAVLPPDTPVVPEWPQYVNGNELVRPTDYRRWIFVGASLGLSYNASANASMRKQTFHHTYLTPRAYDEYQRTGQFPEKTMLVLELYEPGEKVEPAQGGQFEQTRRAVEVAVKDRERFPDGWAYFDFENGARASAAAFPASAGCVSCHREHAAHDNVFTQFYPVLREREPATAQKE
jgi:hypothetical protein